MTLAKGYVLPAAITRILPVEQESFHREIITKAQQDYYDTPDGKPVHVSVYFTNTRGEKRNKGELAFASYRICEGEC